MVELSGNSGSHGLDQFYLHRSALEVGEVAMRPTVAIATGVKRSGVLPKTYDSIIVRICMRIGRDHNQRGQNGEARESKQAGRR
jgi:hypothetical protein